jgi:replication-associated recombination protein RarA
MPVSYENAFALRDNPFGPTRLLEGITKPSVMQSLESLPLRSHLEPKLLALYCGQAGPFDQHLSFFQHLIATAGYNADPPSAGLKSLIFLIKGYQGTGKTTIANAMVHWLKKCKPVGSGEWHVFDPWPLKEFSSSREQIAEIDVLQNKIDQETSTGDYCCVLIDNLVSGADVRALDMFSKLIEDRIVFLFLLTRSLSENS